MLFRSNFAGQLLNSGLLLAITLATHAASAQAVDLNREKAQALLDEANPLMDTGDYSAACPKLELAVSLVPEAIGVTMALGECYEGMSALVDAWQQYRRAEINALRRGDSRADEARMAMTRLDTSIARLAIVVPNNVRAITQLRITLDNSELSPNLWGSTIRLKPGRHTISVSAPHWTPYQRALELTSSPGTTAHVIPQLKPFARSASQPKISAHSKRNADSDQFSRYSPYVLVPIGTGGIISGLVCVAYAKPSNGFHSSEIATYTRAGIGLITVGTLVMGGGILLLAMNPQPPRQQATSTPALRLRLGPTGFSVYGTF